MPKFDLTASLKAAGFVVSGDWTGVVDTDAFAGEAAKTAAKVISDNLSDGKRPDGRGGMPSGKRDGRARGKGTRIATSIRAKKVSPTQFVLSAEEEVPGQLNRILRGIPFLPPLEYDLKAALEALLP